MTHEPDIPQRDPDLDAAWREHSTEMPSAALDAAILAAAHRAVGSAPKAATKDAAEATSPQRWWMPLAAAATIGAVALGILQTMPQQDSLTAPGASDAPAPERASVAAPALPPASAPSAPGDELQAARRKQAPSAVTEPVTPPAPSTVPAKSAAKVIAPAATSAMESISPPPVQMAAVPAVQMAAAPAPQPFPAEKKAESAESDFKDRARMAPKLATAPAGATEAAPNVPPAPPVAAAPMSETARADVRQRNEAQPSAPLATGAVALGKTAARKDAAAAPAVDVDAWIARIRKLHDDGKLADAAKELVALRAAVPDADARLPRELRAWAATVKS